MDKVQFRQRSLNKITSPEELHDYMHVTSPRLWMILTAIAVLLTGFIVYASFIQIENTRPVTLTIESQQFVENSGGEQVTRVYRSAYFVLPPSMKDVVEIGMPVRVEGYELYVDYLAISEGFGDQDNSLIVTVSVPENTVPDGQYEAELVIESTTPISFLWN